MGKTNINIMSVNNTSPWNTPPFCKGLSEFANRPECMRDDVFRTPPSKPFFDGTAAVSNASSGKPRIGMVGISDVSRCENLEFIVFESLRCLGDTG
tara:strand:+ start:2098 stop:2385 length:288 start_codon:yes stop_codon:yes gene_type:complete